MKKSRWQMQGLLKLVECHLLFQLLKYNLFKKFKATFMCAGANLHPGCIFGHVNGV